MAHTTSLDTLETSVATSRRLLSLDGTPKTVVVAQAYNAQAVGVKQRERCERIASCSTDWHVYASETEPVLLSRRCRDRLCPECQRLRAGKHRATYEARLKAMRRPKFLTLTLAPSNAPLREQLTRATHAFNRLRTHSLWKQSVRGGVWVVEITRNPTTKMWHPHIHTFFDGDYVPHEWISNTWKAITGDSYIVHIERANAAHAHYVAGYVGKAIKAVLQPWELWPLADEIKGKRLCGTYGNQPGVNAKDETTEEGGSLQYVCTLSQLCERAERQGGAWVMMITVIITKYGHAPLVTERSEEWLHNLKKRLPPASWPRGNSPSLESRTTPPKCVVHAA